MATNLKGFDEKTFLQKIYDKDWEQRELKQRMKHVARTMHEFMPANYDKSIEKIQDVINTLRKQTGRSGGLEHMCFTEYVDMYGLEHYDTSMRAFEFITQFISCEFAVRPFIHRYPAKAMKQMLKWSKHENHHVRRFASEGSRPRLPWGMALVALKNVPAPILPILENLKNDESLYVRKSVANSLNDIAKDNPAIVLKLVKQWQGNSPHTDWIIKHGSRMLLRKAHPEAMKLFGLAASDKIVIDKLKLEEKSVAIGDTLNFSFNLTNTGSKPVKLRVEFGIDYMKANGKPNRKLFKITENTYQPGQVYTFKRGLSFRDLTTRKHYVGQHALAIVINGGELAAKKFTVN